MTHQLSKNLVAICMRNEAVLWIEKDRIERVYTLLTSATLPRFIHLEDRGEVISTSDIIGIYSAQTMDELNRIKRGEWQCRHGEWHAKRE